MAQIQEKFVGCPLLITLLDRMMAIPVDRVESSLVHLNSAYSNISFNFYRISDIDYIDNTDYYVNIDVLDLVSLLNFILNY